MNINDSVVILSVERTGTSWLGALISATHFTMYGEPIYWDYEISRVIAIDPKYDVPKGHCTVFYTPPKLLLEKGWDKIIIAQRELEDWKRAFNRYAVPELSYEEFLEQYPNTIELMENYYNLIYGDKIDDPRVYYVHMSDLNYYPVDELHRVLDFLEYPFPNLNEYHTTIRWCSNYDNVHPMCSNQECGKCLTFKPKRERPVFIPCKIPERDWDIQGTIINKGQLGDIYEAIIKYTGIWGMMPLEDPDILKYPESTQYGYIKSKRQYVNYEYPNPWKIAPEEYSIQECRTYRMLRDKKPMRDALQELGWVTF